ncbi:hypothetical protein IWX81_001751 [Salinibacterium sp. CAN_S4]|uniref:hypothetical protein n=1 Tax=Salinibacterium sp. CAN_S4 TaxID=2787727 RepID=UPI0018EFE368
MNITKKTAFGATAAAAALVVVGIAGPAMASDDTSDGSSKSYSYNSSTEVPVLISPDVTLLNGDNFNELLNAANGNALFSGNDIQAPIASGNETAIGSGNETAVGNVSDVANGNDVSTDVSDVVDNVTDVSDVADVSDVSDVSDVTDVTSNVSDVTSNVSDLVGDITDSVNLDGMLGGILGR